MKLSKAIKILEAHNKWRRDNSVPPKTKMQNPTELGIAFETVIKHAKTLL